MIDPPNCEKTSIHHFSHDKPAGPIGVNGGRVSAAVYVIVA